MKLLRASIMLLGLTIPVYAQNGLERYDVFVGPSYVQHDIGHVVGVHATGTVNLSRILGLAGDFGFHKSGELFNHSLHFYTYRFGPKFSISKGNQFTFFGQALFGGSYITGATYLSGNTLSETTLNEFNYNVGGGADFKVTDWLAVRLASGYSYQRFQGTPTRGFQIIAGPVIRFGTPVH